MSILIDEQTRQRVIFMRHGGDIVYDAAESAEAAIRDETIPVVGNWRDYTGSKTVLDQRTRNMFAGTANELQGQDAEIENNADLNNLGVVGQNTDTTRRRFRKIHKNTP